MGQAKLPVSVAVCVHGFPYAFQRYGRPLQADAKIKGGFDVRLSVELARDEIKSVLTDTYIAKDFDCEYIKGRLCAGYMKPRFGHEDVMSSFSLYTIERTVATMYWRRQRKKAWRRQ